MNLTASSSCTYLASQSTCDIECDEGYTAVSQTMTCVRGEWVGNATCVASSCNTLPPIEHIDATLSSGCINTESGASCNVTCETGYSEAITTTAMCHKGIWSGSEPIGEVRAYELLKSNAICSNSILLSYDVDASSCAPQAISRGISYFSYSPSSNQCYGSYECSTFNEDSSFNAYSTYVRQDLPWCALDCSVHPPVEHIDAEFTNCGDSSHLTVCDFVCESGYTHTGPSTCQNGTWDNNGNTCNKNCEQNPVQIEYLNTSRTSCEDTNSGSDCTFFCNSDENGRYTPSGPVSCFNGSYCTEQGQQDCGGSYAYCIPDACTSEPVIEHKVSNCGVLAHNQNCTFSCATGYGASGPVMCLAGNHFTSPTCDPLPCTADPDFIYHLNVTSSPCENTESNDTCVYQCDEGFSPSGVATCYLGEWIEGPTCDENPCPGNPVVEHMDENRTTCVGTPSGETCQLLCEDGYTPTVYVSTLLYIA